VIIRSSFAALGKDPVLSAEKAKKVPNHLSVNIGPLQHTYPVPVHTPFDLPPSRLARSGASSLSETLTGSPLNPGGRQLRISRTPWVERKLVCSAHGCVLPRHESSPKMDRKYIDGIYIPVGLLIFGTMIVKPDWIAYASAVAVALGGIKFWRMREETPLLPTPDTETWPRAGLTMPPQSPRRSSHRIASRSSNSRRRPSFLTMWLCMTPECLHSTP